MPSYFSECILYYFKGDGFLSKECLFVSPQLCPASVMSAICSVLSDSE